MGSVTMLLITGAVLTVTFTVSQGHVTREDTRMLEGQDPEARCKLPEVVMMVCDPKSMENFQTVRKQRIRRDVDMEDDYTDFLDFDKRSLSHTSLPLPSRIQFLLRVKYNFCRKQLERREVCLEMARRSEGTDTFGEKF